MTDVPSPVVSTPPVDSDPEDKPKTSIRRVQDVVVIDPGHGGIDYGVDAYQDLLEKVITLSIARQIERRLNERGVRARLTRARDVQLPNEHRSAISNFYRCRLFVGLHLGGAMSESTRGPLVYSYSPPAESESAHSGDQRLVEWDEGQTAFLRPSRRFAALLQDEMNRIFESENQALAARLAVLAPVKAPAVVVETGFLTSRTDQDLLSSPGFQERIADGITDSIIRFLR
jgi:N-acetylmuramoyl-L-alanine amidase